MADEFEPGGLDAVPLKAAEAAAALEALKEPAEKAAGAIEDAFGRAGDSLTRSLARAAADGLASAHAGWWVRAGRLGGAQDHGKVSGDNQA